MSEASKTIALIAVSLVVLVVGIATRPQPPKPPANSQVGESLFPKLQDPLLAKRLRIVTYDDTGGKAREFEVAQVNGVWSLPSHKNYPADAKEQMADAATALVDLKVEGVASENPEDHALYGVVEPDPAKDQFGQKGIGKLVVFEDGSHKPLARIIIGKEDKTKSADDFSSTQTKMRFVRVPGQNVTYRADLSADKFSPKFENWIETDLLKLNPWDITQVELRDYTATVGISPDGRLAVQLNRRADVDLAFNDRDSKWSLEKLVKYKDGKPSEEKLTDNEELNTTKLNEMKNALDDLKIVDVARKPTQMSANLKSQVDFTQDEEAFQSLAAKGFLPVPINSEIEILSDNGEAIVGMKDGVEYVLRFGKISGVDSGSDDAEESSDESNADDGKTKGKDASADKEKEKADTDTLKVTEKKGASVNRYVMVMARFNPDLLEKPELETLPEIKKAPEKKDDAAKADAKADEKTGANTDTAETEAAKKDGDAGADGKTSDEEAKTDENAKTDGDQSEEEDLEALEARRIKIEKENQRKQDEYDEKVKKGEERAKELNGRFADWYYVISDETYRKIHLGIDDIIKRKPQEEKQDEPADAVTPTDPFQNRGAAGAGNAVPAPASKK